MSICGDAAKFRTSLRAAFASFLAASLFLLAAPAAHGRSEKQNASDIRSSDQRSSPRNRLLIRNVIVIDPRRGSAARNKDVLIEGDRIVRVYPTSRTSPRLDAAVVNGEGRYLIPGLWDMHVHVQNNHPETNYLPLFVANGVTGVRDMGTPASLIATMRQRVKAGAVGPEIVAAGPFVDGPKPLFGGEATIAISNASEARAAVAKLKAGGSDFIKLQSVVPYEAYVALAAEAKRQNIPFVGHVPLAVPISEAIKLGQLSIEHFTGVLLASTGKAGELRDKMFGSLQKASFDDDAIARLVFLQPPAELLSLYQGDHAREVLRQMADAGTWHDPNLSMLHVIYRYDAHKKRQADRLQYLPRDLVKSWETSILTPSRTSAEKAEAEGFWRKHVELFRLARRAGDRILAGTDVGYPMVVPGFSIHDELQLMVEAGMTPAEALRTATWNPAVFLGQQRTRGSVEPGKVADLVLLDANPLLDISAASRIHAVVLRGVLHDRGALDEILKRAATVAASK